MNDATDDSRGPGRRPRKRAVCNENDFRGDWRDTRDEAVADGVAHTNASGPRHTTWIETEQG